MAEKTTLDWIALVLVIVGGINWGLALFNFNLVNLLFGWAAWLEKLVYGLVGLSALYLIYWLTK
ncbi:DUF378 domain-containing protein [Candidatus Woesearchaeota archaeon]|nr:DUF378 domain-containing protein [Candidatus Woesearchaeota archaeon]